MEGRFGGSYAHNVHGVVVTLKVGPFDLRREYAAPEAYSKSERSATSESPTQHFRLDDVMNRHS